MSNEKDCRVAGTGMLSREELILGDVPWTKPEVRAVTLSKLDLLPHHHVLDIGAGSGTVTLEIARRAREGTVVAVEEREKACAVIRANLARLGLTHVQLLHRSAPDGLPGLSWDRIFIGGTGGRTDEILRYAFGQLAADGVIVMNTVTIDSLQKAVAFARTHPVTYEVVLLQVSRVEEIGGYELYRGENPVHIITMKPGKEQGKG